MKPYLLGSFESRVQLPTALIAAVLHSIPAVLYADQQVLDQSDILFLTEVFQLSSSAVELLHGVSLGGDVTQEVLKG